jgi:RNA polymerase sigma-70 factor (ECF subfamily)
MDALIVMEGAIIRDEMVNERAAVSGDGAQLVGAACAGDRDAFGRLVRPYLAQAVGAATLITANDADGADAVQDALLVAWQRLAQLRNPELFPAWFRSIVLRAALRTTRRAHRIVELHLEVMAPPDQLDRALDLRTLRRALVRLDTKDRVLLTLHHYWELPVAETARLLDVPEGTVKSRVHYALNRLRAAYEAEERR